MKEKNEDTIMKFKHVIVLFLIGMLVGIVGAWAKILHKPVANILITSGMLLQAIAVIIGLIKLLKIKGKGFLNQ